MLTRDSFLGRIFGLDPLNVYLKHLFFNIVYLLLDMIEAIIVSVTTVLGSLSNHFLCCVLPSLKAINLAKNILAEYLHLACLSSHTHVRAGLPSCIRGGFGSVIILHHAAFKLFHKFDS